MQNEHICNGLHEGEKRLDLHIIQVIYTYLRKNIFLIFNY